MMSPIADSKQVIHRCAELGFALAGICQAEPTHYEQELIDWLAAGKAGEMEYLRRNVELRIDPRAMVEGAKSIIVVADRYAWEMRKLSDIETSHEDQQVAARGNPPPQSQFFGQIARYARGDDYHVVMKRRLHDLCNELASQFPDEVFRACVDTAPVLEREHAQRAGLGAVGKNTLLIQRGVGSYLLLGEIITTLPLAASHASGPDPCGTCTRCIDACPTDAITPWSVDATRCISYLTIEHRGAIDERYHEAMGDWIFGCDICQEVCPHNQPTQRSQSQRSAIHSAYTPRRAGFDLLEVLHWDEDARRRAFVKSSMKRAKLNMMKRNALIAAGNALRSDACSTLLPRIQAIATDEREDMLVRETANQVLRRLHMG